jgi:hypothetical protein
MKLFILKRRIRVLISIGLLFVFLSLGLVQGQDFTETSTSDFDDGTSTNVVTETDQYNVSAGEIQVSWPYLDKDASLTSFYRFEEDGANLTDETGMRDSTNVWGNPTTYTTGDIYDSGYYNFDKVDDYIDLPNNFTFDDYTVCIWVQDDTPIAAEDRPLFGFSDAGSPFNIVQIERKTSLSLRFIPKYTTGSLTTFDRSHTGKADWYMLCMLVDGTDAKFYADGSQLGATETVADASISPTSGSRIGRGSPSYNANDYFKGDLTEFKIWTRALTDAEITAHYNSGKQYIASQEFTKTNITFAGTGSYASRPSAIYSGNMYYFVTLDRENDLSEIHGYLTTNSTWTSTYTVNGTVGDVHNTPSIGVLPNDKLIVFYEAWGNDLNFRISTNTTTEIEEDYARLADWDAEDTRAGQYSYPQMISFSDNLILFFRKGTAAAASWWWDSTQDGVTWDGENQLWSHSTTGCAYPFWTKVGTRILMTASNYTLSGQNRSYVYFGYSDDQASTWKYANGTTVSGLFGNETGLLSYQGTNTTASETILDENNKPIILVENCDDCSAGATQIQIFQYSAEIGTSGTWTLSDITNQDGQPVYTNDRANDLGNLFLDIDNGRPSFYVPTDVGSNWYMMRYNRQDGQTTVFDTKYMDDSVSMLMQSQTVTVVDAPDRLFEAMSCVKTVTSTERQIRVRIGLLIR